MSDKDNIKELFQKELGNYKAKVDPSLWNGIQAGLGSAGAAGAGSSIGFAGKIIIGASIATAITVGSILLVNNNKKSTTENEKAKVEVPINNHQEVKEENSSQEITANVKDIKQDNSVDNKDRVNTITENQNSNELPLMPEVKNGDAQVSVPRVVPVKEVKTTVDEENTTQQHGETDVKSNKGSTSTQSKDDAELIANLSKVKIEISEQKNQFVSFSANEVPEGATINWDFGDGSYGNTLRPEHFYTEAGNYNINLIVRKGNREVTKTGKVSVNIKGEIGTLPNVFTPNGDGRNDVFFIESKHLKSFQLTIMDKNQNVIYTTNDPSFRWEGLDKYDHPAKEGNYIYIIVAEDESGNAINKYQKLTIQR